MFVNIKNDDGQQFKNSLNLTNQTNKMTMNKKLNSRRIFFQLNWIKIGQAEATHTTIIRKYTIELELFQHTEAQSLCVFFFASSIGYLLVENENQLNIRMRQLKRQFFKNCGQFIVE